MKNRLKAAFLFALASTFVGCGSQECYYGYDGPVTFIDYPGSDSLNKVDPGMVIRLTNNRTGKTSDTACNGGTADCTLHPAELFGVFVDGTTGDTIELTILDSTKTEELLHYDALPATYEDKTYTSGDCSETRSTLSLTIDKLPSAPTENPDGGVDGGTDAGAP